MLACAQELCCNLGFAIFMVPQREQAIHVSVSSLNGPLCDFLAKSDWKLVDLKTAIQKRVGIPQLRQRLVVGITEVGDFAQSIAALCTHNDLQITLVTFSAEAVSWMGKLMRYPHLITAAPTDIQQDRGVMLNVVQMNGLALQFMDHSFRRDRDLVLCAVRSNPRAIDYSDLDLSHDIDFILIAVAFDWTVFGRASEQARADRVVVLSAVRKAGRALRFASEVLQSDREVVLAAVTQDALAVQYAASECLDNEILQVAVQSDLKGRFFEGLSLEILSHAAVLKARSNFDFMFCVVKQDPYALRYADQELRSSRELVMSAVQKRGSALEFAGSSCRADPELVMIAVRRDGLALRFAAVELQSNRRVVTAAVRQDPLAIQFASWDMRNDPLVNEIAMG